MKDLTENLGCRTNGLQRDTAVVHLNLLKDAAATRLSRKQVILVHLLSQNFRESLKSSDMVAEVEKRRHGPSEQLSDMGFHEACNYWPLAGSE